MVDGTLHAMINVISDPEFSRLHSVADHFNVSARISRDWIGNNQRHFNFEREGCNGSGFTLPDSGEYCGSEVLNSGVTSESVPPKFRFG